MAVVALAVVAAVAPPAVVPVWIALPEDGGCTAAAATAAAAASRCWRMKCSIVSGGCPPDPAGGRCGRSARACSVEGIYAPSGN